MKSDTEILLAIDYGTSRIGLALGRNRLISPLKVVPAKDMNLAINEIARVCIENKITHIVMGLSLTHDQKETRTSLEVRKFAKLLKIRVKRPVTFVSESRSSIEALESAIDHEISTKKRKNLDHIAAGIILANYYEGLTI